MKRSTLNSSSGFSLVELMVVVAIIGILAAMSVGAVQKQILKARQSESKAQLASLYTSEKAFYSEYNIYNAAFDNIGYTPEGGLRYAVGFTAQAPAAADLNAKGYNAPAAATGPVSTLVKCPTTVPTTAVPCQTLAEATAGGAPTTAVTATGDAFVAEARSQLRTADTDTWTIDNTKTITQTADGIN